MPPPVIGKTEERTDSSGSSTSDKVKGPSLNMLRTALQLSSRRLDLRQGGAVQCPDAPFWLVSRARGPGNGTTMKTNPTGNAKPPKTEAKPAKGDSEALLIHHPEENQTELERWVRRNIVAGGPKTWGPLAALLAAVIIAPLVWRALSGEDTSGSEAWEKMFEAKTASEQAEVASDFPDSKAAPWALLQSAALNLNDGSERLPTSIDLAKPLLVKAQDQFEEALKRSPKSSLLARHAAFGLARTLEVRNELDKAIAQYETIVRDYPDTSEAVQSKKLANLLRAELKKPADERFYNQLYAYKAPEVTLPPLGGSDRAPGGVTAGSVLDGLLKNPPPLPTTPSNLPPVFEPETKDAPSKEVPAKDTPAEKEKDQPEPKAEDPKSPAP